MSSGLLILFIFLALVVGVVLRVWVFQMWNSPDGERYLKTRMQGAFVPLSEEDIAEDTRRAAEKK
jgi:hypothetical protein